MKDRYLAIADRIPVCKKAAHLRHNADIDRRIKEVWWESYSLDEFATNASISLARAKQLDRQWALVYGYAPMSAGSIDRSVLDIAAMLAASFDSI
jgi:hypothetical protein